MLLYFVSLLTRKTGILDADIYGPSVATMLGLEGSQVFSAGGLAVWISIAYLATICTVEYKEAEFSNCGENRLS